jgi:uncharacterized protein (TIGR02996 family)
MTATMTTRRAFLRTIRETWDTDHTPKLAFADYIEEGSDAAWAEYIRLSVKHEREQQAGSRKGCRSGECWRCFTSRAWKRETRGACDCTTTYQKRQKRLNAIREQWEPVWRGNGLVIDPIGDKTQLWDKGEMVWKYPIEFRFGFAYAVTIPTLAEYERDNRWLPRRILDSDLGETIQEVRIGDWRPWQCDHIPDDLFDLAKGPYDTEAAAIDALAVGACKLIRGKVEGK